MSVYKELCDKYNVTLEQRWEKGIEHHPEANQLLRETFDIDFQEYNDYFRWNVGGDGDNGEVMIEQFSVILELRDAELNEKYPNACKFLSSDNIVNNDHTLLEKALSYIERFVTAP